MIQKDLGARRANALRRPIVIRVEAESRAPATAVYDLLADLPSHLAWGGERQGKGSRLVSMQAPPGPASVGTEFATEGLDPMGGFADRSVVTETTRPEAFEFVTEARLTTKRGAVVDWTNVHRYELSPLGDGCRVAYELRVTRVSSLPGMLAVFKIPGLAALARRASASLARRGVTNLAAMAAERSGA